MISGVENDPGDSAQFEAVNRAYYEAHAQKYFDNTVGMEVSSLYKRFLSHIPPGGRILDAGSGSGRDTLAFLKLGFEVVAFDASARLAVLSTRLTGQPTRVASFDNFTSDLRYDGIWACASLLHVHPQSLDETLCRLIEFLKPRGVLYASFKYGRGTTMSADGRWFTDLDHAQVDDLVRRIPLLRALDVWTSDRVDSSQEPGQWLNVLFGRGGASLEDGAETCD